MYLKYSDISTPKFNFFILEFLKYWAEMVTILTICIWIDRADRQTTHTHNQSILMYIYILVGKLLFRFKSKCYVCEQCSMQAGQGHYCNFNLYVE